MKRLAILLIVAMMMPLTMPLMAKDRKTSPAHRIASLIQDYRKEDGFSVMNLGGLGKLFMGAVAQSVAKSDGDPEVLEAIKAFKDLKRILIVDYEDSSAAVAGEFRSRLEPILQGMEMLVEMKEDDGGMRIYAVVDEGSAKVSDMVIFSGDALLCFFGSVSMDALSSLMDE